MYALIVAGMLLAGWIALLCLDTGYRIKFFVRHIANHSPPMASAYVSRAYSYRSVEEMRSGELKAMVDLLSDANPQVRYIAASYFGWLRDVNLSGVEGIEENIRKIADGADPLPAAQALYALGLFPAESNFEFLQSKVHDRTIDEAVRVAALNGLVRTANPKGVDDVISCARLSDGELRGLAIRNLGNYDSEEAINLIAELLSSNDLCSTPRGRVPVSGLALEALERFNYKHPERDLSGKMDPPLLKACITTLSSYEQTKCVEMIQDESMRLSAYENMLLSHGKGWAEYSQERAIAGLRGMKSSAEEAILILEKAFSNPNISPKIRQQIERTIDYLRKGDARSPDACEEELKKFARDPEVTVRRDVAENPSASEDVLKILAQDSDKEIRKGVAEHPNASREILKMLVEDSYWWVRAKVAEHHNTGEEELRMLVQDPSWHVRTRAFRNKNCPPDTGKVDCDKAIADSTQAIKLNPKDINALFNRGEAYSKRSDYIEAAKDFTQVIRINPKHAKAFYGRGTVHYERDDYDRAIADFTRAIKLGLKDADASYKRGKAYFEKDNYRKAIADFTQAIELGSKNADTFYNRGKAYFSKGNYEKAIADCTQAIEFDPKYVHAFNTRGAAYFRKGDYDKSIADCTQAIKISPRCADAYNTRGAIYEKKGEQEKAAADFKKAKELGAK